MLALVLTAGPVSAQTARPEAPPEAVVLAPTACPAGTVALAIHQVKRVAAELPAGRENSLFILAASLDNVITQYLRKGYQFITYGDLYDGSYDADQPCVLLSEDDGHLDFYSNGFPLMQKHGVRMTVFVNSSSANDVRGFIDWEQLQEMVDSGLVDVESHGALHEDFTGVSPARLDFLLTEGKQAIEHRLWRPQRSDGEEPEPWEVRFVAYPRGLVNAQVVEHVRKAGYVGGVALQPRVGYGWFGLRRVYPR